MMNEVEKELKRLCRMDQRKIIEDQFNRLDALLKGFGAEENELEDASDWYKCREAGKAALKDITGILSRMRGRQNGNQD
jgi:uncharacterized iron-regulated protein